jgi:hypothetical protein
VERRIDDTRETIRDAQKEMYYIISLHVVGSTLYVVISIINICCNPIYFMCHILNFYTIIF